MIHTTRIIFSSILFITLLAPFTITIGSNDNSSETLPSEPQNLQAGFSEIVTLVSWDAPATIGSGILEYQYRYKQKKGAWNNWKTNYRRTHFTSFTFTNRTEYTFEVRARNSAGWGPAATKTVRIKYLRIPKKPTNLSATASDTAGAILLSWTAPTDDGGNAITHYEYKYRERIGTKWSSWRNYWISTNNTETTYKITGLTSGRKYRFRVRAVNQVNPSKGSKMVQAKAP